MKKYLCYVCFTLSFSIFAQDNTSLYVGTYTDGESKGIYQISFNQNIGELGALKLVAKLENPSFLIYSPDKKYLYTVGETNNFNAGNSGFVSAFKVQKNGKLQFLNTVSSKGAHPCHISIDSTGEKVAVSNYTAGTIAIFPILANGYLDEANQVFNHASETEISHVHSSQFINDRLFVANLGKNAIYEYKEVNNSYRLVTNNIVTLQENSGPRHFVMSKNGNLIHIINEYSNTITSAIKLNGKFKLLEHSSTLDKTFKAESFCADIHLSNDENFLYGSNRGENSIVVFKHDQKTGNIDKIQTISTKGNWPRNFTLSPNGKYLLVANQKSKNISVYTIDKTTGMLTFNYSKDIPTPVCLLF
ncbi:MAG: 6-phosphogluconolactonase [Lutibacter sp.]|nr:MAG: 6-phosphogluconolactonase [Lutibacter sp.]